MKSTLRTLVLMILFSTCLTSCATIMHGTRQSIGISSVPSNAHVWVDSYFMGQTPIIVEMTRKHNHFVRMELEGYQPYEAVFSRKLSGWAFGNVVFGGIIGLAVDAVSGGIYMLTPEQMQAELVTNHNIMYSKNSKESYIMVVLKADPEWIKIGDLAPITEEWVVLNM